MYARLEGKWVYGERFVEATFFRRGDQGPFERAPVEIHSIYYLGYDTYKKQYYNIFLGDEDVIPLTSSGSYDPEKKTLTFVGTEHDPITGDSFTKYEIFTLPGGDEIGYELRYGFADGSTITAGKGTYRRKK